MNLEETEARIGQQQFNWPTDQQRGGISSERILHKDYYLKGSVGKKEKNSGRDSQEAWREDELFGSKLPVASRQREQKRTLLGPVTRRRVAKTWKT
jgi:hypothetical protein